MRRDARYQLWLRVADELEAFHYFLYRKGGYWHQPYGGCQIDQFLSAAKKLRKKANKGYWYWWDQGWLGGIATDPLRTLYRLIGESGDDYESNPDGRAVVERAEALQRRIEHLTKGLPLDAS